MILSYRTPLVPEPEPDPNVVALGYQALRMGRDFTAVGNLPQVLALPLPDDFEIISFDSGDGSPPEVEAAERFRAFEARVLAGLVR